MNKKDILFYVLLSVFLITVLITLMGVLKLIDIDEFYLKGLFGAFILELAGVIYHLARNGNLLSEQKDGVLNKKEEQVNTDWTMLGQKSVDALEESDEARSLRNLYRDSELESDSIENKPKIFRLISRPEEMTNWFSYLPKFAEYKVRYIEMYEFYKVAAFGDREVSLEFVSEKRSSPLKKCVVTVNDEEYIELPKAAVVGHRLKDDDGITFKFQQVCYEEYWRKVSTLGDRHDSKNQYTQRDELVHRMLSERIEGDFENPLPVCGAGLFIQEEDQLLISKHSNNQRTHPGVWTFSTSCAMNYGGFPHPVMELSKRAVEEISHQINPDQVNILSFGIDPEYGYFHFTFIENCRGVARDLEYMGKLSRDKYKPKKMTFINSSGEGIVSEIWNKAWEPAAEFALLKIAREDFNNKNLEEALTSYYETWKSRVVSEWTQRATLEAKMPGGRKDFVGLSPRYEVKVMEEEERNESYANSVFSFLEDDLNNKVCVVEYGCGPGRITKKLAESVGEGRFDLYAIDICPSMIKLNKERLGELSKKVNYLDSVKKLDNDFVHKTKRKNAVVLDRVLIHNVSNISFYKVLNDLSYIADTIFIFEDVSKTERELSEFTRIRTENELRNGFREFGYELTNKKAGISLCGKDDILFCRFNSVEEVVA